MGAHSGALSPSALHQMPPTRLRVSPVDLRPGDVFVRHSDTSFLIIDRPEKP